MHQLARTNSSMTDHYNSVTNFRMRWSDWPSIAAPKDAERSQMAPPARREVDESASPSKPDYCELVSNALTIASLSP